MKSRIRRIQVLLVGFIVGLVLSGITAFPLTWELGILVRQFGNGTGPLSDWLRAVQLGLVETDAKYPFIAYGTDWLAFGHLVIASAFIGPLRDPVRNKWIIEWGMMACIAVPFLALIAGPIRGIPLGWRLIDCSFGIVGFFPLWFVRHEIQILESEQTSEISKR
jgi:hypothetical protein